VYNSLDCENPEKNSIKEISKVKDFNSIFKLHKEKISLIWKKADVKLRGDIFTQKLIRLNIYHLIISTYYNKDYGIPARGFHGESYRGHIFWDELFILPFFDIKLPKISKSHLRYRYNGLDEAKKYARENGYEGAMYPWQTADDGTAETQIIHYNPKSGKWGPDLSRQQRHVSIAIFYDFFRYCKITNDSDFLKNYSAEVMVEIAKFWASLVKYNKKDKKYHISGVMGPDEFHEKLPNSKEKGLEDNAYTNVMVSWLLKTTLNLFEKFPDKIKKKVSEDEKKKWKEISNNLKVRIKNGIVEQFRGYFDLKEFDWSYYKEKYNDIRRLDRILKAENKSPDDYKVSKQADFLMLYYNLGVREVSNLLKNLGIKIEDSKEFLRENYNYYLNRTSHGSTLSKIVYGVVSTYIRNGKMPRKFFEDVLISDFSEEMNATTAEGIHTGSMAGSLDFFIRRYAGVNYKKSRLKLYPQLPKDWQEASFKIKHQGIEYDLKFNHEFLEVKSNKETKIEIYKKVYELKKGKKIRLRYGEKKQGKFSKS
jgi:trehalose/maltose hydrolase-like predicted phosphorylase